MVVKKDKHRYLIRFNYGTGAYDLYEIVKYGFFWNTEMYVVSDTSFSNLMDRMHRIVQEKTRNNSFPRYYDDRGQQIQTP